MNKVYFLNKLLYFLYLKDLNSQISTEYNQNIHQIILLSYMILSYIILSLTTKNNKFIRAFLVLSLLCIFTELPYILTIKKYNREKK